MTCIGSGNRHSLSFRRRSFPRAGSRTPYRLTFHWCRCSLIRLKVPRKSQECNQGCRARQWEGRIRERCPSGIWKGWWMICKIWSGLGFWSCKSTIGLIRLRHRSWLHNFNMYMLISGNRVPTRIRWRSERAVWCYRILSVRRMDSFPGRQSCWRTMRPGSQTRKERAKWRGIRRIMEHKA